MMCTSEGDRLYYRAHQAGPGVVPIPTPSTPGTAQILQREDQLFQGIQTCSLMVSLVPAIREQGFTYLIFIVHSPCKQPVLRGF